MAKWFHTRLKDARERADLSQSELAAKLGVSAPTISNWENRTTESWEGQRERVLEWIVQIEKGSAGNEGERQTSNTEFEASEADDPDVVASRAALGRIYEQWPQSRIADALSVSQATVSNWLRLGNVASKYFAALRKLDGELTQGATSKASGQSIPPDPRADETDFANWLRTALESQGSNAVELSQRSGVNVNTILNLLEGRTEKPQQRTRLRIEAALQVKGASAPAAAADGDPWYYIGLDWSKDEIDQVPDEPGVYIIHDRLGRPAYIGVAHKGRGGIRARLRKHNELRWTSDTRVARSFSYALAGRMPIGDPSDLAKALEKLLIKFMGNAILINEKDVEDLAEE